MWSNEPDTFHHDAAREVLYPLCPALYTGTLNHAPLTQVLRCKVLKLFCHGVALGRLKQVHHSTVQCDHDWVFLPTWPTDTCKAGVQDGKRMAYLRPTESTRRLGRKGMTLCARSGARAQNTRAKGRNILGLTSNDLENTNTNSRLTSSKIPTRIQGSLLRLWSRTATRTHTILSPFYLRQSTMQMAHARTHTHIHITRHSPHLARNTQKTYRDRMMTECGTGYLELASHASSIRSQKQCCSCVCTQALPTYSHSEEHPDGTQGRCRCPAGGLKQGRKGCTKRANLYIRSLDSFQDIFDRGEPFHFHSWRVL